MSDKNPEKKKSSRSPKTSETNSVWKDQILKILTFNQNMTAYFKANLTDAYQSFYLFFIALPTDLMLFYMNFDQMQSVLKDLSFQMFALVYIFGYLIMHSGYYLLIHHIANSMGQWPEFLKFVQMRNLYVTVMTLMNFCLHGLFFFVPSFTNLFLFLSVCLGGYSIALRFFILWRSFNRTIAFTIGLLALDYLIMFLATSGSMALIFRDYLPNGG